MHILLAEVVSEGILERISGAASFVTDLFNDFKLDSVQTRLKSLEVEC